LVKRVAAFAFDAATHVTASLENCADAEPVSVGCGLQP
jgi:hypothetical protein